MQFSKRILRQFSGLRVKNVSRYIVCKIVKFTFVLDKDFIVQTLEVYLIIITCNSSKI